jgi:flagellar basal-body rod protein FlgF
MDRLIYTAMTGARHILEKQATTAHNLANAGTTGFRAQVDSFRAVPVVSEGLPTRAFVVDATVGADFTPGPLQQTGRALDVALNGPGWLALQLEDGGEGVLQTQAGLNVQGEEGPISVPPDVGIAIGKDGTVSAISTGNTPGVATILGRLKLVNPAPQSMTRGDDGLFRVAGGKPAEADAGVSVMGSTLEGSNVNVVDAMVSMISLARQFEIQQSLLKNAESNAARATQILALT